jgi:hypothetical protein
MTEFLLVFVPSKIAGSGEYIIKVKAEIDFGEMSYFFG